MDSCPPGRLCAPCRRQQAELLLRQHVKGFAQIYKVPRSWKHPAYPGTCSEVASAQGEVQALAHDLTPCNVSEKQNSTRPHRAVLLEVGHCRVEEVREADQSPGQRSVPAEHPATAPAPHTHAATGLC